MTPLSSCDSENIFLSFFHGKKCDLCISGCVHCPLHTLLTSWIYWDHGSFESLHYSRSHHHVERHVFSLLINSRGVEGVPKSQKLSNIFLTTLGSQNTVLPFIHCKSAFQSSSPYLSLQVYSTRSIYCQILLIPGEGLFLFHA